MMQRKVTPRHTKKSFSIVWGLKKFQCYLGGRPFTLLTYRKPLTTIFHPHKGISATALAPIRCWTLFRSGFSYQTEYKNTKAYANADGLSLLPLNCSKEDENYKDPSDIFHLNQINRLSATVTELRKETRNNPILAKVIRAIMSGWPAKQQLHEKCQNERISP